MREPVIFVVPGELISSKNSRQSIVSKRRSKKTGKRLIIPSKSTAAKNDEERLLSLFRDNPGFCVAWGKEIVSTVTECGWPVRLRFRIYRQTHRVFDYVNIVQNLLDCLVKAELLPDDDAKHVIPVFEPYVVDKFNPRTEITIESGGDKC